MIAFSTLNARVLRHAPGCPSFTVIDALREAAIELCERSHVWKHDESYVKLAKNVREFDLSPPVDSDIITVNSVRYDETPILPKSIESLDSSIPGWREESSNQPKYYYLTLQDDAMAANVYPKPSETLKKFISYQVVLRPSVDASGMDSVLFSRYRQILIDGALKEILSINNKPWTDHKLAKKYSDKFENGVSKAISDKLRNFTNGGLEVKPFSIM